MTTTTQKTTAYAMTDKDGSETCGCCHGSGYSPLPRLRHRLSGLQRRKIVLRSAAGGLTWSRSAASPSPSFSPARRFSPATSGKWHMGQARSGVGLRARRRRRPLHDRRRRRRRPGASPSRTRLRRASAPAARRPPRRPSGAGLSGDADEVAALARGALGASTSTRRGPGGPTAPSGLADASMTRHHHLPAAAPLVAAVRGPVQRDASALVGPEPAPIVASPPTATHVPPFVNAVSADRYPIVRPHATVPALILISIVEAVAAFKPTT